VEKNLLGPPFSFRKMDSTSNKCSFTKKLRGECECVECCPVPTKELPGEFEALACGKRKAIELKPELTLDTLNGRLTRIEEMLERIRDILPSLTPDARIKRNRIV
jgi:hypothetical protein